MQRHYITYFDKNYLARGLVLIKSLFENCATPPTIFVICLDEITRVILNKIYQDRLILIPIHEIENADHELLELKNTRSLVEYYWTLTPSIILYVIKKHPKIKILTYVDSDICFFSNPGIIYDSLGNNSILIHEHNYSPRYKHLEQTSGKYNVGLMCFRNDSIGIKALMWWREQCNSWCSLTPENGKFGDQKYLEDFPKLFSSVTILNNDGCALAPWNYDNYTISNENGKLFSNDHPIVFVHFHSLIILNPLFYIITKFSYLINIIYISSLYVPYTQKLFQCISDILSVSPHYKSGIYEEIQIKETMSFIAHDSVLPQINLPNSSYSIIPLYDGFSFITHNKFETTLRYHSDNHENSARFEQILNNHISSGDYKEALEIINIITRANPESQIALKYLKLIKDKLTSEQHSPQSISRSNDLKMINLGCGSRFHKKWTNLDFKSTSPDVQQYDLNYGIPFPDESFDVVYHSHVLEHFSKEMAIVFIKECYRILKKGGVIRIVVPDLENIVREYLRALNLARTGDPTAKEQYEWLLLELYDQTVRNYPGGDMLKYLVKNKGMDSYIYQRCGLEAKQIMDNRNNYDSHAILSRNDRTMTNEQIGFFRRSGEIHQWMYDSFSLKNLLESSGFIGSHVCSASESMIPDYNSYFLDCEPNGSIRKPDSLFMEAQK